MQRIVIYYIYLFLLIMVSFISFAAHADENLCGNETSRNNLQRHLLMQQDGSHLLYIYIKDSAKDGPFSNVSNEDLKQLSSPAFSSISDASLLCTQITENGISYFKALPHLKTLTVVSPLFDFETGLRLAAILPGVEIKTMNGREQNGKLDLRQFLLRPTALVYNPPQQALPCVRLEIEDDDLTQLADQAFRQVEEVNLYGTAITDRGVKHLRNLKHLRQLNLVRTKITGSSFPFLRTLALESLQLDNEMSDEDLAELSHLEGLKELHLSGSPEKITDRGFHSLERLVNLEQLTIHAGLSAAAMETVKKLPHLRKLTVYDVDGGFAQAAEDYRNTRPDLEIIVESLKNLKPVTIAESCRQGEQKLSLSREQLTQLQDPACFRVKDLELSGPELQDEDLVVLEALKELTCLRIFRSEKLTESGFSHLRSLPLRYLDLEGSKIPHDAFGVLGQIQLDVLKLDRTDIHDQDIIELCQLSNLSHLTLDGTAVTGAGLDCLKSLRALSLENTLLNNAGLAEVGRLHDLEYLNLRNTEIDDGGLKHLKDLTHLRSLVLMTTNITGPGLARLSAIPLEELSLWGTEISDAALKHLSPLKTLEFLDLTSTSLNGSGLAYLKPLHKLRKLSLERTNVNDRTIGTLLALSSLSNLNLEDTKITDQGARRLRSLTGLYRLNLGETAVTKEEAARLKKYFGTVELNWGQLPESSTEKTQPHFVKIRPREEDYAVYSAIINEYVLKEKPGGLVIVSPQATANDYCRNEALASGFGVFVPENEQCIVPKLFEACKKQENLRAVLEPRFSVRGATLINEEKEWERLFRDHQYGWDNVRRRYPNFESHVSFSLVSYDESHKRALVYFSSNWDRLAAWGALVYCRKGPNGWIVGEPMTMWES
jgi:internalin A